MQKNTPDDKNTMLLQQVMLQVLALACDNVL